MKFICTLLCLSLCTLTFAQDNTFSLKASDGDILITPIQHATMMISYRDLNIVTDPTGGVEAFEGLSKPNLILITDIHGDHMNKETLTAMGAKDIQIVAPQAVADQLGEEFGDILILGNGESKELLGINIEALPMYNLPEDESSRHTKGRGNGYVLTIGGKRVYVSGDTEDIVEMRELKKIDLAFVCMNLPYTMDVDAAADATLDFLPNIVIPYHYRGKGGLSDIQKFKATVNEGSQKVNVVLLDWYK
ncbi:MBL fold metallo-hydrolase [Reichenbachiella ulvae]|uniref:MBL fold metallo-hydrolase n=1 Tax=Reichenbachiella ulvae TaxID=2980104 RepID=A0ABT3CWE4_9BACT|nr:MBL fold metallo-hydrolase [Reichenbachiella ulvae]MCV9387553.1 MBL fold metallo-hydrolase [Reichenbachiella ulvae]